MRPQSTPLIHRIRPRFLPICLYQSLLILPAHFLFPVHHLLDSRDLEMRLAGFSGMVLLIDGEYHVSKEE